MYIRGCCSTDLLGNVGTKRHKLHVIAECQAIYNTHALHVRPDITLQLQCQHRSCWQSSILAAYRHVHI